MENRKKKGDTEIERVILELEALESRIKQNRSYEGMDNRLNKLEERFRVANETRGENHPRYLEIIDRIIECLTRVGEPKTANAASKSSLQNIALPNINLPTFDGHLENWIEFYETFNSLINLNESLHEIQKFHYLLSSLKGRAREVVKNIEITNDNYRIAWEILKTRFHNHKGIINRHVDTLFKLPTVNKTNYTLTNLVDDVNKNVRALKALKQPIEHWDTLLIHLLTTKLDSSSLYEWEKINTKDELPSLEEFIAFLSRRASLLNNIRGTTSSLIPRHSKSMISVREGKECPVCGKGHLIYKCEVFRRYTLNQRHDKAKELKLCINCLHPGHLSHKCSSRKCYKCSKSHHTLLHKEGESEKAPEENPANHSVVAHTVANHSNGAMLSTANVLVKGKGGGFKRFRAVLDSGSQHSYISSRAARDLRLKLSEPRLSVSGVGETKIKVLGEVTATIKSTINNFATTSNLTVLPRIIGKIPSVQLDKSSINIPSHIKLADAEFHIPNDIDLLLGADIFWKSLCVGQISTGKNNPILQKTNFGWILGGGTIKLSKNNNVQCYLSTSAALHQQLERFWLIEECKTSSPLSAEDQECIKHFEQTVRRDESGRFIVELPFKLDNPVLGDSRVMAEKRFAHLERKLSRDTKLHQLYVEFMREYESLGHMTEVRTADFEDLRPNCYLPHHGVLKADSTTTKLRVVFDASAKTSNGISLNNILRTGPRIQDDLFDLIIRFRKHQIVINADVEKMYRQVLVTPEHRAFQRIIWRENPDEPIRHFELNTLTYGTASAAFLATQCLKKVGLDNLKEYPLGGRAIAHDFYVDDLVTGGATEQEAGQILREARELLASAGFKLRKWASNSPTVLKGIEHEAEVEKHLFTEGESSKLLGLIWNCKKDTLRFNVSNITPNGRVTKRLILSEVAKIFDPLGLLSPVIVKPKILLQKLWKEKIDWDESVPQDICTDWKEFATSINDLRNIAIPRKVVIEGYRRIELHGFSDASEQAYGACIYIRTIDEENTAHVQLLCAKSKVAPLKTVSLPRLELSAALLLARLLNRVRAKIKINFDGTRCWSDSMITLSWIHGEPHTWETFVANRVAEIQENTDKRQWEYVAGKENPADLITRGMYPRAIHDSKLWWNGPEWLSDGNREYGAPTEVEANKESVRTVNITQAMITAQDCKPIIESFSSLSKLQRTIAYILRFANNCRAKTRSSMAAGSLSNAELRNALLRLIRVAQEKEFKDILVNLRDKRSNRRCNNSRDLDLFLDEEGLIRVGGRLRNSNCSYNKRHQLLLPRHHHLTKLIIQELHIKYMHLGPSSLLNRLRERYWITAGLNTVKGVIRKCIPCFKAKPRHASYKMGDLPEQRVRASRPFYNTGVDLAGPFDLRISRLRNAKITKCYVALFVCLATKAVHLELVDDLTSQAFISTLKRFVARRGICKNLFSDNGTNFVGASNMLRTFDEVQPASDMTKMEWHFIPPRSPHFGGLWESLVKSTKYHLKRVMQNTRLTYGEWLTVIAQIEACLNSRPITQLGGDPHEPMALTPGHFLIGAPLISSDLDGTTEKGPMSLNNRYHLATKLRNDFWKRWYRDYLSTLQNRKKWKDDAPNITVGTVVLVNDDNLPPMQWRLGRVDKIYKGDDGTVRVVDVKTQNGIIKRSVAKLSPLPIEEKFTAEQ